MQRLDQSPVSTPQETVVAPGVFTLLRGAPQIAGFSPTIGAVGSQVIITGTDFGCASTVSFGGERASFTVVSSTEIAAAVPRFAIEGPIMVTTSAGSATSTGLFTVQTVVSDLLRLTASTVTRSSTPVPGGPAGTLTVRATFKNSSSTRIALPYFVVTLLSEGNLLLNADGGPGGTGAILTPSVGGFLEPGDSFTTDFVVGLQSRTGFTFLVDLWGQPVP